MIKYCVVVGVKKGKPEAVCCLPMVDAAKAEEQFRSLQAKLGGGYDELTLLINPRYRRRWINRPQPSPTTESPKKKAQKPSA